MLLNLNLKSRANKRLLASGLDSREEQIKVNGNADWFDSYPHEVVYEFNSRGYRDAEWPDSIDDLEKAIWCVGDSFTVGLGVPYQYTWTYMLQQQTGKRTINVSMDGASNQWIADRVIDILSEIKAQCIVTHWSYTHRRQLVDPDGKLDQLERRLANFPSGTTVEEDTLDIIDNMARIEGIKSSTNLIHSFISGFHPSHSLIQIKNRVFGTFPSAKIIEPFHRLDLARDMHHYGKITADFFVDKIIKFL